MAAREDREVIRSRVAAAVSELIADSGFENVTIREIARHLDCSTAVVQHYFRNKRELILYVHRWTEGQAVRAFLDTFERHPDSVVEGLEALLPLDRKRKALWKVWIAFWGHAVGDPVLEDAQRKSMTAARRRIEVQIRAMVKAGLVHAKIDPAEVAALLLQRVHAVALEAIFDRSEYPAVRQRRIIARECARLFGPAAG